MTLAVSKKDLIVVRLDQARALLAQVTDIQKAKEVIAIADAMRVYAKRVKASIETKNYACEILLRGERKLVGATAIFRNQPYSRFAGARERDANQRKLF